MELSKTLRPLALIFFQRYRAIRDEEFFCGKYSSSNLKTKLFLGRDVMLSGKAGNLVVLSRIAGIEVPRLIILGSEMSGLERQKAVGEFLKDKCRTKTVAVRSSADQEDSAEASFAGMYETKLRVPATVEAVCQAAEEVAASGSGKEKVISHYAGRRGVELSGVGISVIVQEMIEAQKSGVIFSHSLFDMDGYYVVSVSDGTGEKIVSGVSNGKLVRVVRGMEVSRIQEEWLRQLIGAMKIIESHYRSSSLDVEFAFKDGQIYILQCRPITTLQDDAPGGAQEEELLRLIESLNESVASSFEGDLLGDMMDINPLELLGANPTSLDISIFGFLFADEIVERVRRDMGYDPLDIGLIRVVKGKPYASLLATAFSFRPLGIPDGIYERMVAVYRQKIMARPALQSRVEFEVYAMSSGEKLESIMDEAGLNESEKGVVRQSFSRIDSAIERISLKISEGLGGFMAQYESQTGFLHTASPGEILKHVALGTEMFVRVARLAFYWKNLFEETYPKESLNGLIAGHLQTVNGQLQSDLARCRKGLLGRDELVKRYGHLRPGQFSIFGEAYADDPETYLFGQLERAEADETERMAHEFEGTDIFKNVVTFMQARERVKFLFSQSLHVFVACLKGRLAERGISQRDASQANWPELEACLDGSGILGTVQEEYGLKVILPDVIVPGLTDLRVITFNGAIPSFITDKVVKAPISVLERSGIKADVAGSIVLLPNADPGFDFLFHAGAAGIITKVGGPASHMCIRSVELGKPACIGCGEGMYQRLLSARSVVLDCRSKQIIIVD